MHLEVRKAGLKDGILRKDDWAVPVVKQIEVPNNPEHRLNQLFSSAGDGTGTTNMIETTGKTYKILVPAGMRYYIHHILGMILGVGLDVDEYVPAGALTNGIKVQIVTTAGTYVLTPLMVKRIAHWGIVADVSVAHIDGAGNNDVHLIHWSTADAGRAITLEPGESLQIVTADNLSTLVEHYWSVKGYQEHIQ